MSPASISSTACKAVTPQYGAASVTAQSSDDGPQSPGGPGWTMIVRRVCQMSAGTRSFRNGQRINSGSASSTASRIACGLTDSSTVT
jgi:hypothetical protein